MKLNVIILAAGQGTRMHSKTPKVLHPLAGKPMIRYVYETACQLQPETLAVVHGAHHEEQLKSQLHDLNVQWVRQQQQLGTGHAAQQALPALSEASHTLILYGDVPLIQSHTLNNLIKQGEHHDIALLTARFAQPTGFGRILRNAQGTMTGIVEEKDANDQQKAINEINTGIMLVKTKRLMTLLPKLKANNQKQEYYLTDMIHMTAADGGSIDSIESDPFEVTGVNSRPQLVNLERDYQRRLANQLLASGVYVADPSRIDIRGQLQVGQDSSIDVNTVFSGPVSIGENSVIAPNCFIENATIGNDVTIEPNTVIQGAIIESGCHVGPFARIRPGTHLEHHAKIGNFVETKKAHLGAHSKANHLAYLGDTVMGSNVNIGAGTITCNYDGHNKHQTDIHSGAFIGSNTSLVAPVTIGKNALVGAGSTITQTVESNALGIARAKQRTISGWRKHSER